MILFLKTTHISTNVIQMSLFVSSRNHIISSIRLISSNVVRIVNRRKRMHILQIGIHNLLEVIVIDSSTLHSITNVQRTNIPSSNHKVIWVHKRKQSLERNIKITSRNSSHLHCRTLRNRTIVVRVLYALLRIPRDIVLVSQNTSSNSSTVIASPANQHHTHLRNTSIGLKHILLVLWSNHHLSFLHLSFTRVIHVVGSNSVIRIGDIRSINNNRRINILISRIHYKSWFWQPVSKRCPCANFVLLLRGEEKFSIH